MTTESWTSERAEATEQQHPLEYAVNQIKNGIRRGDYAPGQRLIEADLIKDLGVKRGYVREALRILAGDGIVELVPQKGARVRKLERADLAKMLPVLGGLLNVAISLAIGRLQDPEFRERLEEVQSQLRYWASKKDSEQFHHTTIRYHQIIVEAAANSYLEYVNSKIHVDVFQNQFIGEVVMDNWDTYLEHFEQLHQALLANDRASARRLVEEHQDTMVDLLRNASAGHPRR